MSQLTLTYRPQYAKEETIHNPHLIDLERVVDELWQEAQYIIKGKADSRFTGHFILEDRDKDYIQGIWDKRFYPAGGFQLEWCCDGNRSWLPLPQTNVETKKVLRLWVEDIQACSDLNWELISDRDPMSLDHPSRRGFKIIHLLKQYEAGERNFRKEDLSNANLFEADLQGINLSHACLVGTDLRGANLNRANLAEADLRDSCLIKADLRSANLEGTKLEGAIYDEDTEFPNNFDPEAAEMEFYTYEEEDEEFISDSVHSRYLETAEEIRAFIVHILAIETLWLDTEIADWNTSHPRLSLIQVLADPQDTTGESAYILDVLNKPEIVAEFIDRIMLNPRIEKVFHNASFDLRYLGGKEAENITCTLKMARNISKQVLGTSNLKLKTLAVELCNFDPADIENEQGSDWGKRPLTKEQIKYAQMDVVYLATLHHDLLEFEPDMPSPTKSFSVTDVRVAVECPRLFYLNKHFGGKTLFTPKSSTSGIGNTFHKLANEFVRTVKQEPQYIALFEPSVAKLEVETIASQMQDIFYSSVFFPNYLQPAIQDRSASAPTLQRIWLGIRNLIYKWTELLIKNCIHCNANRLFDRTFVATEYKLQHNFKLPDGQTQSIVGRLDCLIYDFSQNSLCVVELKTYAPADPSAQLAQVALYSYMVQQAKKVPVDSAVYCVLPFQEYFYTWSELETNLHQVIPHQLQQMQQWLEWQPSQPNTPPKTSNIELCQICPQQEKCQSYFSSVDTSIGLDKIPDKPSPYLIAPPSPNQQTIDPEPIGRELVDILKSFNVNVEYIGAIAGTSFIRIKLKPGRGVKVASILKLAADLQVQLGVTRPPLIATQAGYVSVDLPREDRQVAYFKDYIQPQLKPNDAAVTIALGVDLEGKLIEADLADPNTCHFLVGGTTGSGKSEFLRSLLLSLIRRHPPEQVKIALVDPKRVTFAEFEQMPWLLSPVVKDSEAAIALMEELVAEMEERYQLFESARCSDLLTYNQMQAAKHLPRIVGIFDEYADFMTEKETRKALEDSIKRLGGMARAAGIHLIVATQRPDANVVTPIIRSNLPGRVALSTASEADSKIILGGTSTVAAYLLGKGDLFFGANSGLKRLQSLYASEIEFI